MGDMIERMCHVDKETPNQIVELCRIISEDTLLNRKPPYYVMAHPDTGLAPVIHRRMSTIYGEVYVTVHNNAAKSGQILGKSEQLYFYLLRQIERDVPRG